ncbi:M20/M25/M40 family metallo-hydrolase [Adhaeribacter rhizoryzae]|uniref:M20/M25/M40 family metallo-hydrolase n=1 Tax=Adhaeribacter rhizoryzae TaxID=2607907 RepID=A0A5M6DEG6_9BACT|nr:M20/M25/M40 family metallo-hydrolase [Adhaeribacter rhizoryzae]KAA5544796.1 M20/M25/M40 family metallo-hydrolase [Adhaeribacter rhizoryzae]
MQKRYLILGLSLGFLGPATAQKIKIKEKEVARIVRTLSADDMQGRQVFTAGIQKASSFIQQEFKKIGLEHLSGLNTYEQSFTTYQIKPTSQQVTLNGDIIPAEAVIASVATEELNLTQNNPAVKQANITASANFVAEAGKYLNQTENTLVLVDPAHAAIFKRYKNYLEHSNIKLQKQPNGVIFILTDLPQINTFTVAIKNKVTEQTLNNVVGVLPGKSRKEEFVIFSAHYDHIGILEPINGDSIANGADDDASGTTAVIELAKHFKKQKNNERTLIFVAFTAEEVGGFGSQYFSKQLDPLKISAMFNIEMIGKESQFGPNAGFITGFERSDFGTILQKNLAGSPYQFHPDPYTQQNLFYRSDNATLARLGVPAHSISSDKLDTDKLYHSVDDEFESLNISNMTQIIKAIAKGATSIISGADTPTRIPPLTD